MIQALGYESAKLDVPPDSTAVVATLVRACLLEFMIPGGDDIQRKSLWLNLLGEPPMFVDEISGKLPLLHSENDSTHRGEGDTQSIRTRPDKDGRWRFAGLTPGVPWYAEISSHEGTVLAEQSVPALSPGEHRIVPLILDKLPKSLRIHARDADRRPLEAATIRTIRPTRDGERGALVEAPGTFMLAPIYADRFTIQVEAPGFATKYLYGISVPPAEITVVLEPSRSLEIELILSDGSPVVSETAVDVGSNPRAARRAKLTMPGRWLAEDLPPGLVVIRASGESWSCSRLHDTAIPFTRVVVDGKGAVSVKATIPEAGEGEWCAAIYPEGGSQAEARELFHKGFHGLALGTYDVWLEKRATDLPWEWERVGKAVKVVLDAQHPSVKVELSP
ncbi:MAG TPA: carboxypeptidase-like regulatory domain-containing protein [Planctomycetota bacterium]|nr:carboxypeptidase-like regulatory domain-containing protein [Planctomycetota bacterium]